MSYYKFFHKVVTYGLASEFDNPIEWLVSADVYGWISRERHAKYIARYMVDIFKATHNRQPKNAKEVLDLWNEYYKDNMLYHNYFKFLKNEIKEVIKNSP